jgi:hypothetical protein
VLFFYFVPDTHEIKLTFLDNFNRIQRLSVLFQNKRKTPAKAIKTESDVAEATKVEDHVTISDDESSNSTFVLPPEFVAERS